MLHCAGHRAFNSLTHTLNSFESQFAVIQTEAKERTSKFYRGFLFSAAPHFRWSGQGFIVSNTINLLSLITKKITQNALMESSGYEFCFVFPRSQFQIPPQWRAILRKPVTERSIPGQQQNNTLHHSGTVNEMQITKWIPVITVHPQIVKTKKRDINKTLTM